MGCVAAWVRGAGREERGESEACYNCVHKYSLAFGDEVTCGKLDGGVCGWRMT